MKRVAIKVTRDLLENLLKLPKDVHIKYIDQEYENRPDDYETSDIYKVYLMGEGLPDKYEVSESEKSVIVSKEDLEGE